MWSSLWLTPIIRVHIYSPGFSLKPWSTHNFSSELKTKQNLALFVSCQYVYKSAEFKLSCIIYILARKINISKQCQIDSNWISATGELLPLGLVPLTHITVDSSYAKSNCTCGVDSCSGLKVWVGCTSHWC